MITPETATLPQPAAADHDSFDVRGPLRRLKASIRRHRLFILFTCLVSLGGVAAYMKLYPSVYQADLFLQVEGEKDRIREDFYTGWNVFRKDDLGTEIELLKSAPVLEEVAGTLGLKYDDVYHPFLSHTRHLWEQSWPGRKYKEFKEWVRGPRPAVAYAPTPEQIDLAKTLKDFVAGISVEQMGTSYVGRLRVQGPTPRVAEMANLLLNVYLRRRTERFHSEADHAYRILTSQVEETHTALKDAESRRLAYLEKNDILMEFEKERQEGLEWTSLETSVLASTAKVAGLEKSLAAVDEILAGEKPEVETARVFDRNRIRQELESSRLQRELELLQKSNRFQPESPEIQELTRAITTIRERIAAEAEMVLGSRTMSLNANFEELRRRRQTLVADLAGARATLAAQEEGVNVYRDKLTSLPGKKHGLSDIVRDQYFLQQKYQKLVEKQAEAAVSVASAGATAPAMRIVKEAIPPSDPAWPNTKLLVAAALFFGLMMGVSGAVLWDVLSNRVSREHPVLAGGSVPLYGMLSVDRSASRALVVHAGNGSRTRSRGARERTSGADPS